MKNHALLAIIATFAVAHAFCANARPHGESPRHHEEDDFEKFFEARNSSAMMLLAPPGEHQKVDIVTPDIKTRMTCPVCSGKGEVIIEEKDFGQFDGRLGRSRRERKRCPVCNGSRSWIAYQTPADLAVTIAQARAAFTASHMSNGDVPVGEAFVPREIFATADRKMLKLVEKTYGKACSRCHWSGMESCSRCKGQGIVNCKDNECQGGWLVSKRTVTVSSGGGRSARNSCQGRRTSSSRRTERREEITVAECPTCKGVGVQLCPECAGRRAHPCSKCHGTGVK